MKNDRIKQIKFASWIGIVGNSILAVLKIVFGLISGSLAVVGDGIDSATDIVTSIITLFAARIISKPPDKEHPYGHNRAETLATTFLAFIIFFVGAQLLLTTVIKIIQGEKASLPQFLAVYVTIVSIIGKIMLMVSQFKIGKRTDSLMLIANGKNMQNDILISFGVLIGLFFTYLFGLPIIDRVIALIISIWIIKNSVLIFKEINNELMDGTDNKEIYEQIFHAAKAVDGVCNPHRTRVRKLANMYVVDIDIEVNPYINVMDAHKIAINVEKNIKKSIDNIYDIVVHIEPIGNIEKEEKFGLSHDDV